MPQYVPVGESRDPEQGQRNEVGRPKAVKILHFQGTFCNISPTKWMGMDICGATFCIYRTV